MKLLKVTTYRKTECFKCTHAFVELLVSEIARSSSELANALKVHICATDERPLEESLGITLSFVVDEADEGHILRALVRAKRGCLQRGCPYPIPYVRFETHPVSKHPRASRHIRPRLGAHVSTSTKR